MLEKREGRTPRGCGPAATGCVSRLNECNPRSGGTAAAARCLSTCCFPVQIVYNFYCHGRNSSLLMEARSGLICSDARASFSPSFCVPVPCSWRFVALALRLLFSLRFHPFSSFFALVRYSYSSAPTNSGSFPCLRFFFFTF